ncbi:MAG: Acetate operon repressor [Verrucomicrobiota bacterium]|jgi:DNA-binding IclR family transcriptional regulator
MRNVISLSEAAPKEASRYSVPNLDRALTILEVLSQAPSGMSLTELAARLAIPTNSVFRISRTLEERGYLERNEATKRFCLTQKLLRLSCGPAEGERSLTECALDAMRELRNDVLETVLLGTLAGAQGVVLEQVSGKHPFRFFVDVGTRFELHTAAPGKAILAALPEAEAEVVLRQMPFTRFNSRTITDPDAFRRELARTRANGYGVDEGEEREGAHCIASVILDRQRFPAGAVWITGPSSRVPAADFPRIGQRIRECARQISARLGYFAD